MLYKPVLCVLWLSKHCLLTAFGPVSVLLASAIPWRTGRDFFSTTHFISLLQVVSLIYAQTAARVCFFLQ